ncbi:MAG: hypothetical protein M3450_13720 [Actinomycetota bacterium]|nr:hypothetical protein [Actinomycetota bacterium]
MTLGFMRPTHRSPAPAPAPAQSWTSLECRSDEHLLDGVAGGSQAALKELFRRHGAAVHRLATLLSDDGEEADRVAEDVFVTLWHRSGRLEDELANVRLGLLAMARRRTVPAPDPGPPAAIDPPAMSRLGCLPSRDREVVALTVLGTATLTDVAGVLQEDPRAVGSRLRSGLRAARSAGRKQSPP